MQRWRTGVSICVLVVLLIHAAGIQHIHAQDPPDRADTIAIISSPVEGGTISGEVIIRGSASHPTAFESFQLEYANLTNPTPIWLPITTVPIRQAVTTDEILGIWSTVDAGIADGLYQIRLLVTLTDASIEPVVFVVSNLQLVNTAPTPIPTVPQVDTSIQSTSEVPEIEQPPTATPRPTVASLPSSSENDFVAPAAEESSTSLNFGRLQNAFCAGGIVSLILFGLLIGYLSVRARLRPVARQLMWQIRDEIGDD